MLKLKVVAGEHVTFFDKDGQELGKVYCPKELKYIYLPLDFRQDVTILRSDATKKEKQ